jgi:exportin-7
LDGEVEAFFQPWSMKLDDLIQINNIDSFREPLVRIALEGIFRDLRGFVSAMEFSEAKSAYLSFYEWFQPYFPIVFRALEANHDHPLSNVILRFFAELVLNRALRLQFEISSPNGCVHIFFYFCI